MHNFFKSLKTEFIKKKFSGIFTISFSVGFILPLIYFIYKIFNDDVTKNSIPVNYYFDTLSSLLIPFVNFFFPLIIIISASKIAQIDSKNNGWHLMETQPTTKSAIYFSKFTMLLIANAIAIVGLLFFTFFFSWLLPFFKEIPSYQIIDFNLIDFIKVGVQIFVLSLCIAAFQYVLSVLIKSFIWPILIGLIAMLLPKILQNYSNSLFWYPYQMLSQIADNPKGSDIGNWITYTSLLSILFAVLFLFIGYNKYRFKTFYSAFFSNKISVFKFVGVIVVLGAFIRIVIHPKQQNIYNKTIIAGEIQSDRDIHNVYIFDILIKDTIAKIKVNNGKFHKQINKNIIPSVYNVNFDFFDEHPIFFGAKDSLYIKYQLYGDNQEITINGTRLAENKSQKHSFYNRLSWYLSNNKKIDNEKFIINLLLDEWHRELYQLKSTRTIDNFVVHNDFRLISKKMINLKFLTYWNTFKKAHNTLYPNKKYIVPQEINDLNISVSLNDEKLLNKKKYFDFVMSDLIKDDNREISKDAKYFDAILKLKKGIFKDKLLFVQLKKNIEEAESAKQRDSLMNTYVNKISKNSYIALLLKKQQTLNRLSNGLKAPNFILYDSNNKKYSLNSFKGKYLLIDVWGTWCGSCLSEMPYFEKQALNNKKHPIVFMSLNIDKDANKWKIAIKDKGISVLQLHSNNKINLIKNYDINLIPRFILIDPNGNIVDNDFERPSNKNFNSLLQIKTNNFIIPNE